MSENVMTEPYITARCSGETHWIFSSKVNSVGMYNQEPTPSAATET